MTKKETGSRKAGKGHNMEVERIRELLHLLEETRFAEVEIEQGDVRIRVARTSAQPAQAPIQVTAPALPAAAPAAAQAAEAGAASVGAGNFDVRIPPEPMPGKVITSPIVGTFYRAPAPDKPPYVENGGKVKKGQVVCIVEAMKLMNEIESEFDGTVAAILVEDGEPVEFGQPLMRIES